MSKTRKVRIHPQPSNALNRYDAQAYLNSEAILAGGGGSIISGWCSNQGAGPLYLMFFDAAALPGNGATPLGVPVEIQPGQIEAFDFNIGMGGAYLAGEDFDTGLVWAASTTKDVLTVDNTNALWPTVRYVA